jgi:hypothetical protein
MHNAHKTYLAGPDYSSYEIDVMDFIHCEMYHGMLEHKNPIYAPYVTKLILDSVEGLIQRNFTQHMVGKLQVLTHDGSIGSRAAYASSNDDEEEDAPPRARRGARRKNATPSGDFSPPSPPTKDKMKKLNWFQMTMLCMTTTIHKESYDAYVELKCIIHNQGVITYEINELRGKPKPPKAAKESSSEQSEKTISYKDWNINLVKWADFSGVTSQPSTSNVDIRKKQVADNDDASEYETVEESEDDSD